ncbi:MAG: RNA methyltransferase [Oscillospiraceae bacterium]|jgi:TrmH family RNA methyltransferase|nr:RNA methyltransferase [Oscillospiraceae bacterium]
MEILTSRSNSAVKRVKSLANKREYRYAVGEFVCDGLRCLREAVMCESAITAVFASSDAIASEFPNLPVTRVSEELLQYMSPLKDAQDVIFTCKPKPSHPINADARNLVLDGVQDPGNVGTIIRSAAAFGIDTVILVGDCADLYNPKTVRATMGAIFRQNVWGTTASVLSVLKMPLYGASLGDGALDIRETDFKNASVAIGSEGAGLSAEVLAMCRGLVKIPMEPDTESLNAAIAASVIMWEMYRGGENRYVNA